MALTLNDGICSRGIDSVLSVMTDGDIRSVMVSHPSVFFSGLFDFYLVRNSRRQSLFSLMRNQTNSSLFSGSLEESEILHLHWTPGVIGFSALTDLPIRNMNIVWTLHDMFPLTGGCHHAMDCEGFRSECLNCPQVRPLFQKRVQAAFQKKVDGIRSAPPIAVVTPSRWLADKALSSEVFRTSSVSVIPNPVDTNTFRPAASPIDTLNQRLTVGCNATNLLDPMKGVLSIISVLEIFQSNNPGVEVELLAIGGGKLPASKIAIRQAGFVSDQSKIVKLYQEMDVFVSMSLAEVFPLSIAEAQSCGVPVICMNSGGMPEMVEPGVNGFVAQTPDEMLHLLMFFSQKSERTQAMRAQSRLHAVSRYSTNIVVDKYLDLYSRVLNT